MKGGIIRVAFVSGVLLLSDNGFAQSPVRTAWSAGFHAGQSSDTANTRWQQLSLGHRWKKNDREFRINTGYLQLGDQRKGLADTWLRATWLLQRPLARQWWDMQWRLKLPTADEQKGLGTGGLDNEGRVQALVPLKPVLGWYYVGHRWRGSSDVYRVQNGMTWGLGASWQRYSLAYDGRESAFKSHSSLHHISLMRQWQSGSTRLTPYVRWRTNGEWSAGVGLRF